MKKNSLKVNVAIVWLAGVLSVSAAMVSTTASAQVDHFSFSSSRVEGGSMSWDDYLSPTYLQEASDPFGGLVSTERSLSVAEGTANASSSANLSTGQLRTYADVTTTGSSDVLRGDASAKFGDTFHAYSGSDSFAWTSSDTVTFHLDLSGIISETGNARNSSELSLNILPTDKLDAYYQWIAGDAPRSGWDTSVIEEFVYWLGPDNRGYSWIDGAFTSFPLATDITFAPGGDFSFVLSLHSMVDTIYRSAGHMVSDFSHTAAFSYSGPAGTTTVSASGFFPGTVSAIPEPSSYLLILFGLIVVFGAVTFQRKINREFIN